MSKLKNCCRLETDAFFRTTGKNTEKINTVVPTVFFCNNSPHGTTTPASAGLKFFTQRNFLRKKTNKDAYNSVSLFVCHLT